MAQMGTPLTDGYPQKSRAWPNCSLAGFGCYVLLILALGSGTVGARAQVRAAKPSQSADPQANEDQLRRRLRDYLARTVALVPLKDIEIVEIDAADAHGIRKVVVRLNNSQPPVTNFYYITADGGEVLRGPVEELSSDPWSSMREKLAPLVADAPAIGPSDAPVTLIEFADLQCPFCAQLNGELEELRAAYPTSVRWTFRDYPVPHIHPWAQDAAVASECVATQGPSHFWKFQHLVFQRQQEIETQSARRQLRAIALQSGVAVQVYDQCLQSPETSQRIQARMAAADILGITATPTLFLNGRKITGAISLDSLKVAVEDELALISGQPAGHVR